MGEPETIRIVQGGPLLVNPLFLSRSLWAFKIPASPVLSAIMNASCPPTETNMGIYDCKRSTHLTDVFDESENVRSIQMI